MASLISQDIISRILYADTGLAETKVYSAIKIILKYLWDYSITLSLIIKYFDWLLLFLEYIHD